jgi:hypothetical protein
MACAPWTYRTHYMQQWSKGRIPFFLKLWTECFGNLGQYQLARPRNRTAFQLSLTMLEAIYRRKCLITYPPYLFAPTYFLGFDVLQGFCTFILLLHLWLISSFQPPQSGSSECSYFFWRTFETLSLTLRASHRRIVSEYKELRNMFEPKRSEIIGDWTELS